MVPSFSMRARRFCTVPRATRRVLAKEATDNRALSRNKDSNCRSVASIGPSVGVHCLLPRRLLQRKTILYKTSTVPDDIARNSHFLINCLAFLWPDDLRN